MIEKTKSGADPRADISCSPCFLPKIETIFFGGSHNPAFTNPTFLPEPPNPIFAHSSNMTLAPCFAASKAAEQPVKPPPTLDVFSHILLISDNQFFIYNFTNIILAN